jgi:hypothetical protein
MLHVQIHLPRGDVMDGIDFTKPGGAQSIDLTQTKIPLIEFKAREPENVEECNHEFKFTYRGVDDDAQVAVEVVCLHCGENWDGVSILDKLEQFSKLCTLLYESHGDDAPSLATTVDQMMAVIL